MSRSPRDVQRVKTQGQGKGAILFGPWPAGQLFYQVDSQCRYEAETGLPDEAITGLNAVRAPEGDFRLARDPAFRPAGSFRSSQGASKCAVAPEEAMFCFGGTAGNTLPLRPVLLRFYPRRFPPKRNPGSEIP